MTGNDPIRELQAFIDARWVAAQPNDSRRADEMHRVRPEITPSEAAYFLAAVANQGNERPLFDVDDHGISRSDRYPPRADGVPRIFYFFEEGRDLRLETIVHWAAVARLRDEFGWPGEHLIVESPSVLKDGSEVLRYEALDILVLEDPCPELVAKMPIEVLLTRVGVEVKADAKGLDKLISEMRACLAETGRHHDHTEHKKCLAIAELRPRFFLAVAGGETWRLFSVVEREGRVVLGDELPELDGLHFKR